MIELEIPCNEKFTEVEAIDVKVFVQFGENENKAILYIRKPAPYIRDWCEENNIVLSYEFIRSFVEYDLQIFASRKMIMIFEDIETALSFKLTFL